jgi:DNA-binding NarL/FixJ family response regulator
VIRVLLVDDQELVRSGFRMILEETADITVVGEAADGAGALAQARGTRPDVVLMDVRMPGMDGIQATRRLRDGARPGDPPRVIILTTFDLDEYVFAGLQAGPAASCSRTPGPPTCWPRSAWSLPGRLWPPPP